MQKREATTLEPAKKQHKEKTTVLWGRLEPAQENQAEAAQTETGGCKEVAATAEVKKEEPEKREQEEQEENAAGDTNTDDDAPRQPAPKKKSRRRRVCRSRRRA